MSDQSKQSGTVTVPINDRTSEGPSAEALREYREYQAKKAHGTDRVTITVGETRGGNSDVNFTDNHGNRLNAESNNGVFDFCANGTQLSDAQIRKAMQDVRSQGTRADYRILTALGISDEAYDFKGPNPIEKACTKPDKGPTR